MKRVHTKIVIDILSGAILEDEWFDYDGIWALLKESAAEKSSRINLQNLQAKAAEDYYKVDMPWQRQMAQQQMDTYNRQAATQEQLQREAMNMSKEQYDSYKKMVSDELMRQHGIQDPIIAGMTPYLSGKVGFDDSTMRLMNDENMSSIAGGYGDANSALKARLLAMGGGGQMPGGLDTGRIAEFEMGKANAISGSRRDLLLANARQKLMNQFNASSALMGVSGQAGQNVGIGAGTSTTAAGQYGAGANTFAQNPIISMPGQPAMLAPPKPQGFWSGFGQQLLGTAVNAGMSMGTGIGIKKLGGGG